jgi:hypothetical protein
MSGFEGLRPPAIGWLAFPSEYEFTWKGGAPPDPPRARSGEAADDITSDDIDLVRWGAPTLQLFAAPGVAVSIDCPVNEDELDAAREVYCDSMWKTQSLPRGTQELLALAGADRPLATSSQQVALTLERRQDPWSLPVLGSPRRATPKGETGLAALRLDVASPSSAIAIELPGGDGVEITLLSPMAAAGVGPESEQQSEAMAAIDRMLFGRVRDVVPLQIRIRVDPLSDEDRFAYDVSYLDEDGQPVDEPTLAREHGPWFRLTVLRTAGVQVYVDQALSDLGREDLEAIVDYREKVVPFCDVPFALGSDAAELHQVPSVTPAGRSPLADLVAAAEQALVAIANDPALLFDGTIMVIGFIPNPVCEIATTAYDVSTLLTYAVWGEDPFGRPMTRWEAMLTAGGVLLPVSGAALRKAADTLRGVARPGGSVAPRLADALETSAGVTEATLTGVLLPLGIGTAVAPLVVP